MSSGMGDRICNTYMGRKSRALPREIHSSVRGGGTWILEWASDGGSLIDTTSSARAERMNHARPRETDFNLALRCRKASLTGESKSAEVMVVAGARRRRTEHEEPNQLEAFDG